MTNSEKEEEKRAMSAAMALLARRDLSSADLARRLVIRGFSEITVGETTSRLQEAGYLDDRRFALRWADSVVRNGRGYGAKIRLELCRKMIPEEFISEALEFISDGYVETDLVAALLARKFPGFDPLTSSDKEKRRVVQFMQRRGFSLAAIFNAFRMGSTEG